MRSRSTLALMLGSLLIAVPAAAAPPACTIAVDECVKTLIAETAGVMSECGHLFPEAREIFEKALQNWPVLKLPIPGLAPLMDETSIFRVQWRQTARERLAGLPASERQAVCSRRLAMLTQPEPTLMGDSVSLPADALKKYSK